MNEKTKNANIRHEVIQRYCPKRGENVVMLRTYGEVNRLQCMNYDLCDSQKDSFCGGVDDEHTVVTG